MQLIYCDLPLHRVHHAQLHASNQAHLVVLPAPLNDAAAMANQHVRLMRRATDMDSTRFALSGKLADVCAALDQLAAQETRNAWRVAFQ